MSILLRAYLLMASVAIIGLGVFYFLYLVRFESRRNYYIIGLLLVALCWIFSSIIEVVDANPERKIFWYMAQYFSLIGLPPLWIATSAHYCRLSKRAIAPLLIPCSAIAVFLLVLFATNPLHRLVFASTWVADGAIAVSKVGGPGYFIYLTYIFVGCATGLFIIASNMRNMGDSLRRRTGYVLAAIAFPLAGGLVDLFWPEFLGDLDVAPISALFSIVFLYLGMARQRLLNPLPMAKSDFIDKLADPVIVIDEYSAIIYANEQAKAMASALSEEDRLGRRSLERIVAAVMALIPGQDAHMGGRTYKASVKPVLDKGRRSIARILSLADVTELRDLTERLEGMVRERTADLENITLDLEEEVEKVRSQEARLKRSLEEKELLLREVNHRVKNNLQVISSLIRLQSMRTEGEEAKEALDASMKRVRAISLAHDRMYGAGHSLDRVDAGAYLADIVSPLISLCEGLGRETEVKVDGGGIGLSMDLAMNLGLVVNEAVTNAFKHVFRPGLGSSLRVSLADSGEAGIVLTILDDGPGIPQTGPEGEAPGLGMSIIRSIAERMDGELSVGSGPGGLVRLAIPRSAVQGEG